MKMKLAGLIRLLGPLKPLVRYLRGGQRPKLSGQNSWSNPSSRARAKIDIVRGKLLSLGFVDEPLAELTALMRLDPKPTIRCLAARELALWNVRAKTREGYSAALEYLRIARRDASDPETRRGLVSVELLCHFFLNDMAAGHEAYESAALAGELGDDAVLAWANFQATPELRLVWINEVLRRHGSTEIALLPDALQPTYDRLTSAVPLAGSAQGPKVTVLMAAYDAPKMIQTALRSLREQTWQNLEILVLDDCSPSKDMAAVVARLAEEDPRIRLIEMPTNGGAYVARNRGLDEATGDFVTIHDADDWSHPQKIERQVRYLLESPKVMGCTSEQARALDDLSFVKPRGGGGFISFNTSSLMFRRVPVREALGYWDTVRFGADNEFIRRIQRVFREESVRKLPTGPLSFQRDAPSSVTSDPVKGLGSFHYYGVRREYFNAQLYHHRKALSLRYSADPSSRPFPVPPMMLPQKTSEAQPLDIVFAGDFRQATPEVLALVNRIRGLLEKGQRIGLVETYEYERSLAVTVGICDQIRELIDGDHVRVLVYGEEAETALLEQVGAAADLSSLRFSPKLHVLSSA